MCARRSSTEAKGSGEYRFGGGNLRLDERKGCFDSAVVEVERCWAEDEDTERIGLMTGWREIAALEAARLTDCTREDEAMERVALEEAEAKAKAEAVADVEAEAEADKFGWRM